MGPKQVIVMRKDLNMRKGKMIAQGAHASLKVLLDMASVHHGPFPYSDEFRWVIRTRDKAIADWVDGSFAKICVYVHSEEELNQIIDKAKAANLPHALIVDEGRTEFGGKSTKTCCAVGPGSPAEIDSITGHLPLL